MDNQTKDQINSLIQDNSNLNQFSVSNVPFHTHNGSDSSQLVPTIALQGFPVIKVSSAPTAPTDQPANGTFRYYVDSTPNYYLWSYLLNPSTNKTGWVGVKLGASTTSQYQTPLTEDNNTTGSPVSYTQTISGLNFAPTTVFYTGTHDLQTFLYGIDGIATKNGNVTTGNCRWFRLGTSSSIGQSVTKLGESDAVPNSYFTVSAWNSDGVVISKTLGGSSGSGNDKFAGILTLIG